MPLIRSALSVWRGSRPWVTGLAYPDPEKRVPSTPSPDGSIDGGVAKTRSPSIDSAARRGSAMVTWLVLRVDVETKASRTGSWTPPAAGARKTET